MVAFRMSTGCSRKVRIAPTQMRNIFEPRSSNSRPDVIQNPDDSECLGGDSLRLGLDDVSVDPMKGSLEHASPRRHFLQYAELASMPDDVLMVHLQGGKNDALAVLFDRYHRLVFNVALRILRDRGEAEDLVQSVFLEIFRSAAQFNPAKGSTKVWILQYAYHRGFNRRQYLNLRGIYGNPEDSVPTLKRPMAHETRSLAALDSARAVQQALAYLSKVQRRTLELAF